jgi:hypothetical protein
MLSLEAAFEAYTTFSVDILLGCARLQLVHQAGSKGLSASRLTALAKLTPPTLPEATSDVDYNLSLPLSLAS